MVRFEIPGAPVAKGRPRVTTVGGHARAFTPAKTVRYESTVALAAQQAMAGRSPFAGPVRLEVAILLPVPASWSRKRQTAAVGGAIAATKRPDADNVAKAVLDGCNGVVFADDSQIVELHISKRYSNVPAVAVIASELLLEAA